MNVAADVYCRGCNRSFALSALTHDAAIDANVDLAHPPDGAWYRHEGTARAIGATHRSLGAAMGCS